LSIKTSDGLELFRVEVVREQTLSFLVAAPDVTSASRIGGGLIDEFDDEEWSLADCQAYAASCGISPEPTDPIWIDGDRQDWRPWEEVAKGVTS
jgi:hypothetical protein